MVLYEGQHCTACSGDIWIDGTPAGVALIDLICENCGPLGSYATVECRGPNCKERVFFGGKSGKSPICVRTGSSHFIDCVDAQRFRRSK